LSSGWLIQVPNEKAIHLEKRPPKTPAICVRKLNHVCEWRGYERSRAAGTSALWLRGRAPLRPIVSLQPPSRISLLKKWRALMVHYFFQADYRGIISVNDDVGEEFSTLQDAQAHAAVVANELARNCTQDVAVSVLDEDGILLAKAMAPAQ
jgi:hypothetical protein